MVVETQPSGNAKVGANLEFVLQIQTSFLGAIVAVRIALQVGSGNETVGGVGSRQSLEELREIGEPDHTLVRSLIPRIELGVGKAAAKGERVFAVSPDGVCRRHEAVLKYAGPRTLGIGAHADVGGRIGNKIHVVRR